MKTIKLPIQPIAIDEYLREYNKLLRICYNLIVKHPELKEKELRESLKGYDIDRNLLDSWFIQSALWEAKGLAARTQGRRIIFGGKKSFKLLQLKKITRETWKSRRTYPITVIGEALKWGNRKFAFNLKQNQIVFRPKQQGVRISCLLPKLKNNLAKELLRLQVAINTKKLAVTFRLSSNFVWITYDETKLAKPISSIANRILAVDLNPNSLGWSICENGKVIKSEIIDIKNLTQKTRKASNSKESLYQTNKRIHETFEINKHLVEQALHWCCSTICLEDLGTSKMVSFRPLNRLIKNNWSPNRIQENLLKRCNEESLKYLEVQAHYSSTIGNILYGRNHPDAIASSIELARRALEIKKSQHWSYPGFIDHPLLNRWKEETREELISGTWKSFHCWLKTSKVKYRSSVEDFSSTVFRLNSKRSKVNLLAFG
jgi:hypothetical protein